MKNIIFFSGNQLRHKFIADKLISKKYNLIWISMKREKEIKYKGKISRKFKRLLDLHNRKRISAEKRYFSNSGNSANNMCEKVIKIKNRNDDHKIIEKIFDIYKPKIFITYGCKKININRLKKKNNSGCYFWNIHAGLSPRYRGSVTHFWPSYLLEPEYTGVTLHEITEEIDWGPIIDQTKPTLRIGDGIHDIACKSVLIFGSSLKKKIENVIISKKKIKGIKQSFHGRVWTNKMWSPKHLIVVYEIFKDKIIDYCLKNKLVKNVKIKSVLRS